MSRWIVDVVHVGRTRYQREWVRCGKSRCERCKNGPSHGPYWYSYEPAGGRTQRSYLGKSTPPAVLDKRSWQREQGRRAEALAHEAVVELGEVVELAGTVLIQFEEQVEEAFGPPVGEAITGLEDLAYELEKIAKRLAQQSRNLCGRLRRGAERTRELLEETERADGSE